MPIVDAPIVAVTVYTDRARVTRQGKITLSPGEHTLILSNLPTTLEEDSVRASGRGAGVKILGVEVKTDYLTEAPEAHIAELEKQVEAVTREDKKLAAEDEVYQAQLEFLKTLRDNSGRHFAITLAYNEAKPADVKSVTDYLAQEFMTVHQRRREIEKERIKLALDFDALQHKLKQVRPDREHSRRKIEVSVEAEQEVEFELDILYAVKGASWQPLYDIRLLENEATLTYMATVRQQSGEDWPEVQLSLSTARPSTNVALPEHTPWYIGDYARRRGDPLVERLAQYGESDTLSLQDIELSFARSPRPAEPKAAPPPPAAVVQTTIEESGSGSVTYRAARPLAVPSDGTPHRTTVVIERLSVEVDYVTTPRLAEEVYLRGTITNTSSYTLLPGNVSLFNGTDFVGKMRIDTIVPGKEFKLQFGVDDRVRVSRRLLKRETGSSKKILSSSRRTAFSYKIALTNQLSRAAKITVFDQFPYSQDDSIEVKLEEVNPKPSERLDFNGLKWELELAAGERQELVFSFSVEHPPNIVIRGLET